MVGPTVGWYLWLHHPVAACYLIVLALLMMKLYARYGTHCHWSLPVVEVHGSCDRWYLVAALCDLFCFSRPCCFPSPFFLRFLLASCFPLLLLSVARPPSPAPPCFRRLAHLGCTLDVRLWEMLLLQRMTIREVVSEVTENLPVATRLLIFLLVITARRRYCPF